MRKMFRNGGKSIKLGQNYAAIPAVMSCHKDEHNQFVEFGPEACIPDFAHLDERSFRNFLTLYAFGHCYVDMTTTNQESILRAAALQTEEPIFGTKLYWSTMTPELLPGFKTDPSPDREALNFMLRVLAKFGGSIKQLMRTGLIQNYNLTPHIYKKNCKYGFKSGEMPEPHGVRLCHNCHTCNFIWLQHPDDGVKKQHCGACFFSLDLQPVDSEWYIPLVVVSDLTQMGVGTNQLHMAMLVGDLDKSGDLCKTTVDKLIAQDVKNMRKIMSRKMFRSIKVNNGMSKRQLDYLRTHNLSFQLIPTRGTPNPHAMLAAERKLIWYSMVEKVGVNQAIVEIGARKCRDNTVVTNWHGIGPTMDWRDVERYSALGVPTGSCGHMLHTCDCELAPNSLFIAVDSLYDVHPAHVIEAMTRNGGQHLLFTLTTAPVNFDENEGKLFFDQGEWFRDGSKLLTSLACDDRPYENDWGNTKVWSTAHVIVHGEYVLNLNTYNVVGNHIMRVGHLTKNKMIKPRATSTDLSLTGKLTVQIPLIQRDSWLSQSWVPVIVYEQREIDMQLMRALQSRNLTGGVSFEKMLEFGLAYAHTKYTTPTKTVQYNHLSAEDVRVHALLATVHTRRKLAWLLEADTINDPKSNYGVTFSGAAWMSTVEYLLSVLTSYEGSGVMHSLTSEFGRKMEQTIMSWMEDPFWDILDGASACTFELSTIIVNTTETQPIEMSSNPILCNHHGMACSHGLAGENVCRCCGIAGRVHDDLCECCWANHCNHKCNHPCPDPNLHLSGRGKLVTCECCQVQHNTTVCLPCKVLITKNNSRHEPPVFEVPKVTKSKGEHKKPNLTRKGKDFVRDKQQTTKPTNEATAEPVLDGHNADATLPDDHMVGTIMHQWLQSRQETSQQHQTVQGDGQPQGDNVNDTDGFDTGVTPDIPDESTEDDRLSLELAKLTNYDYAMSVAYGLKQAVLECTTSPSDYNCKNRPGVSQIRFMPFGRGSTLTSNFQIMTVTPVVGDGKCGWYALQQAIGDEASYQDLVLSAGNKRDWFSADDLIKYCGELGKNCLLLFKTKTMYYHTNASDDSYVCIRHGSMIQEGYQHWEPVNVLQQDLQEYLPCWHGAWTNRDSKKMSRAMGMSYEITELSPTERLKLAVELNKKNRPATDRANYKQLMPFIYHKDGNLHLSNNVANCHDVSKGLIDVVVPSWASQLMENLCSDLCEQVRDELLTTDYDLPALTDADGISETKAYLETLVVELRELAKELTPREFESRERRSKWKEYNIKCSMNANGIRTTTLQHTKLKTGDLVHVGTNSRVTRRFVTVRGNCVGFLNPDFLSGTTKTLKMYIPKESYKSKLLNLLCALRQHVPIGEFKDLIVNKSSVLYGPGGSGKTTHLISQLQHGDVIVVKTRIAKETIISKLETTDVTVCTHEHFSSKQVSAQRLFVDECTMFNWFDLFVSLTNLPDAIYFYGDLNQVGAIDTHAKSGTRDIRPVSEWSKNIKTMTTTYRYGKSLAQALTAAGMPMTSMASRDTEMKWIPVNIYQPDVIRDFINQEKPNVILTFYNSAADKLRQITNVDVETVHSYQSREADNVMVIQWNTESRNSKIWLDYRYCVSAATRCRHKLTWVGVGLPQGCTLESVLRGARAPPRQARPTSLNFSAATAAMGVGMRWMNDVKVDDVVILDMPQDEPQVGGNKFDIIKTTPWSLDDLRIVSNSHTADIIYNWAGMSIAEIFDGFVASAPRFTTVKRHGTNIQIRGLASITFEFDKDNLSARVVYGSSMFLSTVRAEVRQAAVDETMKLLLDLYNSNKLINWYQGLDFRLKELLYNNWGEQLGMARLDIAEANLANELSDKHKSDDEEMPELISDSEEAFDSDGDTEEFHEAVSDIGELPDFIDFGSKSQENIPARVGADFINLLYPISDYIVCQVVQSVLTSQPVSQTKSFEPEGATLLHIYSGGQRVFTLQSLFEGMNVRVNYDATAGKISEEFGKVVSVWNNQMLREYRGSDMWWNINKFKKDFVKSNFGDIVIGETMTHKTKHDLLNTLHEAVIAHLESIHVQLNELELYASELLETNDADMFTNTVNMFENSDDNYHLCPDAESWWATNTCPSGYDLVELDIEPDYALNLRLLNEQVSTRVNCGVPFFLRTNNMEVRLDTFGGCALCAGLSCYLGDVCIMKICPRKTIRINNKALIRRGFNYYEVGVVLNVLSARTDIVQEMFEFPLETIEKAAILHQILMTPGYELGMLFERVSQILPLLKTLPGRKENWKLCVQHNTGNKALMKDVSVMLKKEWKISKENRVLGHSDWTANPIQVVKPGEACFVQIVDGTVWATTRRCFVDGRSIKCCSFDEMVDRMLRRRVMSVPWKIARICMMKNPNKLGIGAQPDEHGSSMNMSMEYHRQHNTEVYNQFRQRIESELLQCMIKPSHILFMHADQYKRYNNLTSTECANLPTEIQNYDIMERGFDQLVENVGIKFFYNELPQDTMCVAITDYPYLAMASSCWGVFCHYGQKGRETRYFKNLLDCNPILLKIKQIYGPSKPNDQSDETKAYYNAINNAATHQIESGEGPWFTTRLTPLNENITYLYMGLTALWMNPAQICDLLKTHKVKKAVLKCPVMFNDSNKLFKIVNETKQFYDVAYDGSNETTSLNKETYECVANGKIWGNDEGHLIFHTTGVNLGHSHTTVLFVSSQVKLPRYCVPVQHMHKEQHVVFKIPRINDLRRMLAECRAMEVRTVKIESKLYRSLSLRMLRPNTTFNDLLAYARAYANSTMYTSINYHTRHQQCDTSLMEASLCVYYESTRLNDSISEICKLLCDSTKPATSLENVWASTKAILINMLNAFASMVHPEVKVDDVIKGLDAMLKTNENTFIQNLTKFRAIKIVKEERHSKLLCRQDGKMFGGSRLQKDLKLLEQFVTTTGGLTTSGLKQWWNQQIDQWSKTELVSQLDVETTLSTILRELSVCNGQKLSTTLFQTVGKLGLSLNCGTVRQAATLILSNLADPIQVIPNESTYTQLIEFNGPIFQPCNKFTKHDGDTLSIFHGIIADKIEQVSWRYPENVDMLRGDTILFSTIGTLGDVEPFRNLAKWLSSLGTTCKFMVCTPYDELLRNDGFEVFTLNLDSERLIKHCICMESSEMGIVDKAKALYEIFDLTSGIFDSSIKQLDNFFKGVSLVMETPFTHIGVQMSQRARIPFLLSSAYPWECGNGNQPAGTHQSLRTFLTRSMSYLPFFQHLMNWRAKHLGVFNNRGVLVAAGGTPTIYLHQRELTGWCVSKSSQVIGYPPAVMEDNNKNEREMMLWASELPTAAICMGSMLGPEAITRINRCKRLLPNDIKQVLIIGNHEDGGHYEFEGKTYRTINQINYNLLFPFTVLVMCHGGCGTVTTALRHGNAVLVDPFFGDQNTWAEMVTTLKLGWSTRDLVKPDGTFRRITRKQLVTAVRNAITNSTKQSDSHSFMNFVASYGTIMGKSREYLRHLQEDQDWDGTMQDVYTNECNLAFKTQTDPSWADVADVEQLIDAIGQIDSDESSAQFVSLQVQQMSHVPTQNSQERNRCRQVRDGECKTTGEQKTFGTTQPLRFRSYNLSKRVRLSGKMLGQNPKAPAKTIRTQVEDVEQHQSIRTTSKVAQAVQTSEFEQPLITNSSNAMTNSDRENNVMVTKTCANLSEENEAKRAVKKKRTCSKDQETKDELLWHCNVLFEQNPLMETNTSDQLDTENRRMCDDQSTSERTQDSPCAKTVNENVLTEGTNAQNYDENVSKKPGQPSKSFCVHAVGPQSSHHIQHFWQKRTIAAKLTLPSTLARGRIVEANIELHRVTLFNPANQGTCVYDCISMLMTKHGWAERNIKRSLIKLSHWCSSNPLPVEAEILAMLRLIGIPIGLVVQGHGRIVNFCGTPPKWAMSVTYQHGLGHAVIKEVKTIHNVREAGPRKVGFTALYRELNQLADTTRYSIDDFRHNWLCKPSELQTQMMKHFCVSRVNILAQLKLNNYEHVINRHGKCIFHVGMTYDDKLVHTNFKDLPFKLGQVALLGTEEGFMACMCVPVGDGMVFLPLCNTQNCKPDGIVMYTEVKLMPIARRRPKLILCNLPAVGTVTCLNEATRSYALKHENTSLCTTIMDQNATHLMIYECDGRKHHMYDEVELVKRFDVDHVIGLGVKITGPMYRMLTEQNCGFRYAILKGKSTAVLEFTDEHVKAGVNTLLRLMNVKPKTVSTSLEMELGNDKPFLKNRLKQIAGSLNAARGHTNVTVPKWADIWGPITADRVAELKVDLGALEHLVDGNLVEYEWKISDGSSKVIPIEANPLNVTCVPLGNSELVCTKYVCVMSFRKSNNSISGGADEPVNWKLDHDYKPSSMSRWWGMDEPKPATNFDVDKWSTRLNTEALTTVFSENYKATSSGPVISSAVIPTNSLYTPICEWANVSSNWEVSEEQFDMHVVSLWTDGDLSDWNDKFGPTNDAKVFSRLPPTQLRLTQKTTLKEYPAYSRPVLTKCANQEFNAVTGRLCKVVTYRKFEYNIKHEITEFMNTYFDPEKHNLLCDYQRDKLTFNDSKVLDWLRERPDSNKIADELEMILSSGLEVNPINNIKVHLKLESLLKEVPAESIKQVKARPLMWQTKGYCALFSHIFKEVKIRLKNMLKANIVYSDGLRADELAARVRQVSDANWLLENDLAQQDKQTDHQIIAFEMALYKELGVDAGVVNLWHRCHFHWKYKAATVMGIRDAMRLTGQATTAIGNAITNMLVHRKLAQQAGNNLKLFLILGDDGLMFTEEMVDVHKLNAEMKTKHNMMCKPRVSQQVGTFCCMLVAKNHLGQFSLGPDYVRMRRRFEVTNGVSESTDANLAARTMSYAMMLGATPEVMNMVTINGWPIEPLRWYDVDTTIQACRDKYSMEDNEVYNNYHELIQMMNTMRTYDHDFLHWEEKW